MDTDTIFPVLTNGEQILRKYRYHSCCSGTKFTAIITNHRLLTRLKQTVCCCFHRSSYKAISLESIHRIDEHHHQSKMILYIILWIFWLLAAIAGVLTSIFFADGTIKIIGIVVSAIPLTMMSMSIFICLCCCIKRKFIGLHGTFGSLEFLLEKSRARLFEADLSEQISQAKQRLQSTSISTVSSPAYYLRNEILTTDQKVVSSSRF